MFEYTTAHGTFVITTTLVRNDFDAAYVFTIWQGNTLLHRSEKFFSKFDAVKAAKAYCNNPGA